MVKSGGGYHVTQRIYYGNYLKVESLFQVPVVCVSEPDAGGDNGVLPEFVHGFHTNAAPVSNFDAGLMYGRERNGNDQWQLFHGGNALAKSWDESDTFYLTPGSQVYMTTVVSIAEEKVITELRTSRTTAPFMTLKTALTVDGYKAAMKSGCKVYREILMATNREGTSYYNTRARFEFAKFTYGKLTTLSAKEVDMGNTGAQTPYADGGYPVERKRINTKIGAEAYEGKAFGYELGSCDMTSNPHFDYSFE